MKKILKRNSIAHITGNMVREDALQQRLYWAAAQKEEALLAHYGAAPTGLTQEQAELSRRSGAATPSPTASGSPWPSGCSPPLSTPLR